MTAETDISAIDTGGANTALEVRTALTSVLGRADGVWVDYTPTWSTSGTAPSLGNWSIGGRYQRRGDLVIGRLWMTAGSTTNDGTGSYRFSLPLALAEAEYGVSPFMIGTGYMENAAVAGYGGFCWYNKSTSDVVSPLFNNNVYDGITPFTFGNGDFLMLSFEYETDAA